MKKITLTIGLVAAMLSTKAQDTTDVVVTKTKVYYFERGTTNCTKQYAHDNNIVFYASEYEVIQFHLLDAISYVFDSQVSQDPYVLDLVYLHFLAMLLIHLLLNLLVLPFLFIY